MIDWNKIKVQFPFFKANPGWTYLDSSSTTLKPWAMVEAEEQFYLTNGTNAHSSDYPFGRAAKAAIDHARHHFAQFINATQDQELIFVPSATFALNQLVTGMAAYFQPGDEIVLTYFEHTSNLIPWFRLAEEQHLVIKYVPWTANAPITKTAIEQILSPKTKVVSFANIANTIAYEHNVPIITQTIKAFNPAIKVIIDASQAIAHTKTDVKAWGIDALLFSGHKLYGPTGIGVLWVKTDLLSQLRPLILGGGTIEQATPPTTYTLKQPPTTFEAGSPNVAGIIGLDAALTVLESCGLDNIIAREAQLKAKAIAALESLPYQMTIYNRNSHVGIIYLNFNGVHPHDLAHYLSQQQIAVRSGMHCAPLGGSQRQFKTALRISFGIYNNEADIDRLIAALLKGGDELGFQPKPTS